MLVPPDHHWRSRRNISIKDLGGKTAIIGSRHGQSRRVLDDNLRLHNVKLNVMQIVDSYEVVRDLVRQGVGLGIIGSTGLMDDLEGHHLEIEEETATIDVHFACQRERLRTPMFKAMFEATRSHLLENGFSG